MEYTIARHYPHQILSEDSDPKVTLYMATHRDPTQNEADRIRFGNLLKDLEGKLKKTSAPQQSKMIMQTLSDLKDDRTLWNQRLDGLCVFINDTQCVVYILSNPPRDMAIVGQRFHTKPLLRDFQGLDEYQILALSAKEFTLYEGNKSGFRQMLRKPDEPRTIGDFLGKEFSESYLAQGSYGGVGGSPMFHGHKSKKDEIDKDIERYLKLVDKHVKDHYSTISKKPLILFALPEYHSFFETRSNNPYLLKHGIKESPNEVTDTTIKKKAWKIIEPHYEKRIDKLKDQYTKALQKDRADYNLNTIAKAAVNGRIDTILIEAFRVIPGRIDTHNGLLIQRNKAQTKFDDALDDLTDIVLTNGGTVHVIPEENMPSDTGAAAIYRY